MDDIEKIVKEKEYRNFEKSNLGLGLTKKSLHEYVEQKFKVYIDGTARLNHGQEHLDDCEIKRMWSGCFSSCLKKSAVYENQKWKWNSGHDSKNHHHHCKCGCEWQCACEAAFTKILSLHRKGQGYRNIYWENSANPSQIPLEWLIAKMFMPQGNKETNKGPVDTDPYAMFQLMQNCSLFFNSIRPAHLKTLKNAKNMLFHSPDNLVKDEDLEKYFEAMIGLLSDASNDQEVPQETRDKIITDIAKITTLQKCNITLRVYKKENRQLLTDVNLLKTESTSYVDEVQTNILEELKHAHLPSNEKMTKLRNDANGLSEGLKDLKQNVQGIQKLSEGFETMRVEIGQWQRALRVEVSQLESEGVIVVIIVVVVMSWLFRILLFIG